MNPVVDCLTRESAPEELLSSRIVLLSLLDTWKHGEHPHIYNTQSPSRRLNALCTPR